MFVLSSRGSVKCVFTLSLSLCRGMKRTLLEKQIQKKKQITIDG